ncbi:MAG: HAD hydrolase family protein, partial [Aeromonas sp.]
VEKLLATYGLDLSQAVAFGDGMNDVEMLSMVGRGVVMANAHDRLKNALPQHAQTLSNHDDGVAHYLEQLFALSAA